MDLMNSLENNYIDDLIKHQEFSSLYLKNGIRLRGCASSKGWVFQQELKPARIEIRIR